MGYGVLLGAAAALAAIVVHRASRPSESVGSRICATAAACGIAVIWVAVTQTIYRADPQYALLGGMVGAFLVVAPLLWSTDDRSITLFPLAVAVFGFGALLGEARYSLAPERAYWALPTLPAAAGLLGAVVGTLLLGRTRLARWGIAGVAIALAAAGCLLHRSLLLRYEHITLGPEFTSLVLLGWLTFVLMAATAASRPNRQFGLVAPVILGVMALLVSPGAMVDRSCSPPAFPWRWRSVRTRRTEGVPSTGICVSERSTSPIGCTSRTSGTGFGRASPLSSAAITSWSGSPQVCSGWGEFTSFAVRPFP